MAHEISHMWFGNLVTMEWWDDLWLNEGFARFCEHDILNQLRPEFNIWAKYFYHVHHAALCYDWHKASTHPIRMPVPEPEKLQEIFDGISYNKGSAICRMLN